MSPFSAIQNQCNFCIDLKVNKILYRTAKDVLHCCQSKEKLAPGLIFAGYLTFQLRDHLQITPYSMQLKLVNIH